jgi:hypothetical protein
MDVKLCPRESAGEDEELLLRATAVEGRNDVEDARHGGEALKRAKWKEPYSRHGGRKPLGASRGAGEHGML